MTAPKKRIAVTGLGVVCALGRNQTEFWANMLEGRTAVTDLELFEADGCLSRKAAQVREWAPPRGTAASRRRSQRRASRTNDLCVAAAEEAAAQAGLSRGTGTLSRFGVSLGTSTGGMLEAEQYCSKGLRDGFDRSHPSAVLGLPTSAPADAVARSLRLAGPRATNMTACASSGLSIGFAADLIRSGSAPGMIAGGGDALCLMTYAGFNALRLLDIEPCRPFDASRQGLSLGEGAGMLVLEDWDAAAERGATPLAEFLDYGTSCDASHMTAPHPEGRGAASAMAEALLWSGVPPEQVGHINAHGTGTSLNDLSESRAIQSVFGEQRAATIPVTANKSLVGHLLGGSGGVEAVALVLSLVHQTVPPTSGFAEPDAEMKLDVVGRTARRVSVEHGISNSFGFGGTNCSLVFRRCAV